MKETKHRLRIVYERLESAFGEHGEEIINPYYDGLVNFDIFIDPEILNEIRLSNWGDTEEVKLWKDKLGDRGQTIKKHIEKYLEIDESMYEYFVGIDDVSLYHSFVTEEDYIRWSRERTLDNIL